ncbi:hypothetical protein ASG90_15725 [Nocardioides sp. Soil797]|nr:hypothetical protein ASG90_15725 [Nocardioides sp. Soil797]
MTAHGLARVLLRLLAVLGLAAASLVLFGAPAQACSCMAPKTDKQYAAADAVFTGSVVGATKSGPGTSGEIVYDVEVDRSFKGDVEDTVQVATAASSASCGLEGIPKGADYLFFGVAVAEREGMVTANLCGGSAPVRDRLVKKVEAVAGAGTSTPSPSAEASSSGAPTQSTESSSAADSVEDDSDSDDGIPVWPFIGGVLVIALAAGAWAARRTT